MPLVDVARPEGTPDPGVPQAHLGQVPIARQPGDLACAAWWSRDGRCSLSWPSRPSCRSGSSGLIRHSRTRLSICGLGTWNGPVAPPGADPGLSLIFLRGTRHLPAAWRSGGQHRQAWRPREFCRCASCSRSRPCVGHHDPVVRAAGGAPVGGCSLLWPARSSSALSRPSTRWRCSCWPWPHG